MPPAGASGKFPREMGRPERLARRPVISAAGNGGIRTMTRTTASIAGIAGAVLAMLLSQAPAQAQSVRWVPGNGMTCDQACGNANRSPVVSGIYVNGSPFFVCRANADNAGLRPGWNLPPDYATTCSVASSNQEQRIPQYDCLCERR